MRESSREPWATGSALRCVAAILCSMIVVDGTHAQANRIVPVNDWSYDVIERFQRRGFMTDLDPTELPYREEQIKRSLAGIPRARLSPVERSWIRLLESEYGSQQGDRTAAGFTFGGEARSTNSRRLDPLRPIGDAVRIYQALYLHAFIDRGDLIAQIGARHDGFYDRDPDGFDTGLRLQARSEDAYVGFGGRFISVYAGRFDNHWAPRHDEAPLLSNNPRSYDQLKIRVGGSRFSVHSVLGELDSVTGDGRFTGVAGDDSVATGSERRYIVAHRLDWRPSRHVHVAMLESVLYSGRNAGISPKYLLPTHVWLFEADNVPKNDENNAFLGGMIWLNFGRTTIYGQLVMDDFDVLGSGEPASFILSGSAIQAGIFDRVDVGIRATLVASRTYNALQNEGKYVHLLRGLGTQFSDYVHGTAFADIYLDEFVRGLTVSPRIDVLAQGAADIRDPFPEDDEVPTILVGQVADTYRSSVELNYQPVRYFWVRADIGLNHVRNADHVKDRTRTRLVGLLQFGARVSLTHVFSE